MASGADALVQVKERQEFRNLDLVKLARSMSTPGLVDGRNLFRPEAALAAGFDYTPATKDLYRIRAGEFRIIYEVEDQITTVLVLKIGDRKEIYKR